MPAGYSQTPLVRNLGIKTGMRCRIVSPPLDYNETLGPLPEGVTLAKSTRGEFDFIHLFAHRSAALDRKLPGLKRALKRDGMLWISWPKRSSGVETDLTGDTVRRAGLDIGLVDIKVCAVDDTWSGLKFVYRTKDR